MEPTLIEDNEATVTTARPVHPWCLFHCGRSGYAVGLESVAEVVEVERLVRLPQSTPRVLGLCSLRREVIPVLGLNDPDAEPDLATGPIGLLVLILRTSRGTWAVRIDAEGTAVVEECFDPSPVTSTDGPAILGSVRRGNTSYAVIDPEATWRNVRRSVEDFYRDRTDRDPSPEARTNEDATGAGRPPTKRGRS